MKNIGNQLFQTSRLLQFRKTHQTFPPTCSIVLRTSWGKTHRQSLPWRMLLKSRQLLELLCWTNIDKIEFEQMQSHDTFAGTFSVYRKEFSEVHFPTLKFQGTLPLNRFMLKFSKRLWDRWSFISWFSFDLGSSESSIFSRWSSWRSQEVNFKRFGITRALEERRNGYNKRIQVCKLSKLCGGARNFWQVLGVMWKGETKSVRISPCMW